MSTVSTVQSAIETRLQQAISHHQSGNLADAEALYRAILARYPGHPRANHNLGVLALQCGRTSAGLPHLKSALENDPDRPQFWMSYIDGLMRCGLVADVRRVLAAAGTRGPHGDGLENLLNRLENLSNALDRKVWMPDLAGDSYKRVLERLHSAICPKTYLEIGVETGATLALAQCPSIGIDPRFQFRDIETMQRVVAKPALLLYQMPSDDFFARYNPTGLLGERLDMAFLDGMHRCEYLLRDFLNTERHCHPNSVIALHDCVPLESPMAERSPDAKSIDSRRQRMWTGDVWRTALLLKRRRPDLRMAVLDAAPTGLVLITNLNQQNRILVEDQEQFVQEMQSWSLEQITLDGYYEEMGIETEINFRRPEQIRAWLQLETQPAADHSLET
jgi:hypothetical protein